jgi:MoaA/NifB/PqqE/SkfB family radical SAM enzyme
MTNYIDPRQKSLWHLDRLLELKTSGKTSAPVNVEMDLSNRCSLGCSWCHFGYTHTKGPLTGKREGPADRIAGGDLMETSLAFRILWELGRAGVQSVTFAGGGEPTLHPDFDEIVRAAVNSGLQVGLYTHGGHIDAERAALLKALCTWVYVSLDECTAEEYKRSKGVDRFDKATAGIANLASADGKATVGVGFLIHKENYQHSRQMITLGKALGADYVQFRPTIHYAATEPGQPTEDTGWMKAAIERLRVHSKDSFVSLDLERFADYQKWQGHGYTTCYWAGMQTVITPNGKVWRCANKREQAGALVGDLTKELFADIWGRGGSCAVDNNCRVMCRGHIANQTINAVMTEPAHSAFV